MKGIIRILAVFLLALAAGGCLRNDVLVGENWEDEVLYAKECGLEGMICCEGEEACFNGLTCCANPGNLEMGLCFTDCGCGEEGKFCCSAEPACGKGLACADDICLACGGLNEPCCPGDEDCAGEMACYRGKCVLCGVAGNPCCEDGSCDNSGLNDMGRVECANGLCQLCGAAGRRACPEEPACDTGSLLNNNKCYQCGELNEPCCDADTSGYICGEGLGCELGFCS